MVIDYLLLGSCAIWAQPQKSCCQLSQPVIASVPPALLPSLQDRALGADFLPPCLAPLSVHADATNLALLADPSGERCLPRSPSPPLDWSLKTTVRFSSPSPFAVVDEALCAPGREVVAAQRAFSCGLGTGMLSMRQQVLASLLSYQFPQDPQPPALSLAAAGGRARPRGGGAAGGPSPQQLARRQAWQAALCSLYDAFRAGRCGAFYCVSPEGSRNPFVAFFGAAGLGGRRRLHGLLTRTTAGQRSLLARDGCGLATPLMPDARAAAEDQVRQGRVKGSSWERLSVAGEDCSVAGEDCWERQQASMRGTGLAIV